MLQYRVSDRALRPNSFRAKIYGACFIGLLVPLVVSVIFAVTLLDAEDSLILQVAALLVFATLASAILTLLAIRRHLLPVYLAAEALQAHCAERGQAIQPPPGAGEPGLLLAAVQQTLLDLDRSLAELQAQAITDPLTGAGNRRLLIDRGNAEIARANRLNEDLAVILVDLDRFKLINEAYGYEAGDQVLIEVVAFMLSRVRPYDTLARMGGEEFCILLPGVHEEDGSLIAERIRAGLAKASFAGLPVGSVTASFGVTERRIEDDDILSVVRRADERLTSAKRSGRNQVAGAAGAALLGQLGCGRL